MAETIAAKAMCGAKELLEEAEQMLARVLAEKGPGAAFSFPNTVYYLPIAIGMLGKPVESVDDLQFVLQQARTALNAGGASGSATATLLAAESIEALRALDGASSDAPAADFNSPISDVQVRSWGIQLADGRMPGVALLLGRAQNDAMASRIVERLREDHILCLLGNGGISQQVDVGVFDSGSRVFIVQLGETTTAPAHAMGFLARCAMKLGGHKPGQWSDILHHCRKRAPGFVLALGALDERECALAMATTEFGFAFITDTAVPEAAKEVTSLPPESLEGQEELATAARLAERSLEVRGLEPQRFGLRLPVAYSPGFEEEVITDADLRVEFGGKGTHAFELLQTAAPAEITDGKIEIIGADLPTKATAQAMDLGIVVKVAGPRLQTDYESMLERQIRSFVNYAAGIRYTGERDDIRLRVAEAAARKGLSLRTLGEILTARFRQDYAAAIEKVEVTLITDATRHAEWLEKAHRVHEARKQRLASLTDSQVDVFYVCTRCRAFAPNNVSIISPQRVSPCGQCNWLDAKASYELNPVGKRRPIQVGKPIDIQKGIWEGTNEYARAASHGRINQVALYSLMHNPMSACGDFDCIVMLIPDANGVMVVSHEDASLPTPAGLTIDTFSSITAGEQIPGVVGVGKDHLLSPKFIAAEGGFKRVVWMSSRLKAALAEELKEVCEREGDPELMQKIADERNATTVAELLAWLKAHKHPALQMEKMY